MPIQFKQFAFLLMLAFGIFGCSTFNISKLKQRAENGDAQAQLDLGNAYRTRSGVKKSLKNAFKWTELAAKSGLPEAQAQLGLAYANGHGVHQDFEKAREWFLKSANQEYPESYCMLGDLYRLGMGVPVNLPEAAKWYKKGAVAGIQADQFNLGIMYSLGEGVEKNYVKAYQWLTAAQTKNENWQLTLIAKMALAEIIPKMTDEEKTRAKVTNEAFGY